MRHIKFYEWLLTEKFLRNIIKIGYYFAPNILFDAKNKKLKEGKRMKKECCYSARPYILWNIYLYNKRIIFWDFTFIKLQHEFLSAKKQRFH